ncbi:hypothetical protein CC78DRAFT_539243 [Lojkania enalia]|uniref:DUF7707 domain-containing protein n=1 Tax=Lojkania enalia TaxID=147567 RepID=A0A9P4NCL4_9PLEO|nr:hypothetical protein CC78DRAFT_539243 [Didymosphaeria enalia]
MRSIATLSLLALVGFAAAQDTIQQNYPYTIDPDSVSESDRQTWCDNQKAQCPLICLQQPGVTSMTTVSNECDPDTLVYQCVCENNVTPNITQYTQTLPYYICTEWGNQCVDNCGQNNNACANDCRANHPCGAQSPDPPNSSVPTTMSKTATPTGGSEPTDIPTAGFLGATEAAQPGQGGGAGAMLNLGQSYGLAIVFAGVFAGFAIVL